MDKKVAIKLLDESDLDLLLSADTEVFDAPIDPHLAKAYLAHPDYLIALAIEEEKVMGMASGLFYFHPDKPLELFINEVGVAQSHHRRGIGRRLMECVLEAARARGVSCAWVATETDNHPARALYRSLGAEEADAAYFVFEFED